MDENSSHLEDKKAPDPERKKDDRKNQKHVCMTPLF
jgi:hypothetical protein